MKFNLTKCVFVIRWGKFLSFLVSNKGIEPDPEEIYKILDMTPQKIKDVQCLIWRLVTLNRFISRLGEQSLPFFKILKNITNFECTLECQKAFEELKVYFSSLGFYHNQEKIIDYSFAWRFFIRSSIQYWSKRKEVRSDKPNTLELSYAMILSAYRSNKMQDPTPLGLAMCWV